MKPSDIDWNNTHAPISTHFTVHEATWLPSWGIHHIPSDDEKTAICEMAESMDSVRGDLGKPINVHVWIRPSKVNCPGSQYHNMDYNHFIGGASHSGHIPGRAVDFDAGENCDDTRATLEPTLEDRGLRMERKPGGPWVHLDNMPPHPNRYFIP